MRTISKTGKIFSRTISRKNGKRSAKGQAYTCPPTADRVNFLNYQFLPVIDSICAEISSQSRIENSFFSSLDNLATVYNFNTLNVKNSVYPENINLAYCHAKEQLEKSNANLCLVIAQDEIYPAVLATINSLFTGIEVYYVPVKPLVNLIRQGDAPATVQLLLSIFSYFSRKGAVPFFTEDDSYLQGCYQSIQEYMEGEEEEGCEPSLEEVKEILDMMNNEGEKILNLISNPRELDRLNNRLACYVPENEFQENILSIAQRVSAMLVLGKNISDYLPASLLIAPVTNDYETPCFFAEYVSFFWGADESFITEQLDEMMNIDFGEKNTIESPATFQLFDGTQRKEIHDLSFPKEFFAVLGDLCYTLNNLTNDKHYRSV